MTKSTSKLLLFIILGTLFAQTLCVRVSSKSQSQSSLHSSLESSSSTSAVTLASGATTTWFSCTGPTQDNNWVYNAGFTTLTCAGNTYLGPYAAGASVTSPKFSVGAHKGIIVSFKIAFIDSWDAETFKITADDAVVYSKVWNGANSPSNTCRNQWKDHYETVTFGFNHTASTLTLVITSALDSSIKDEAWGICDFTVTTSANPVTSSGITTSPTTTTPASPATSSAGTSSGSSGYSMKGIFPKSMDWGCVNINTVASVFTNALTYFSGANSATKSIIDTTVNTVVTGLLNNPITGDVASSGACLGNFAGSYITSNIDECSAMLLPDDSEYSVLSFNVPVAPGTCSAEPEITMAAFCVAMGTKSGLPSVSIQANAGSLSCISTAVGSGVGYAIGSALEAGLDSVSLGISLTSSFEKTTTIFTGKLEEVQISGNYYDYLSIEIDPSTFGLPEVFEITGSATRVVKVVDNAATWVNKLSTANKVKDVATTLFGDLSYLAAVEAEVTLALAGYTFGLLPDLGPYQLGLGSLYATMSPATLVSGQTLKTGVYTYVTANNVLPAIIGDIASIVLPKVGGIVNTILKDYGISVKDIIEGLNPKGEIEKNEFGFMVNTDEIGLRVQTKTKINLKNINPLYMPNFEGEIKINIQCTFRYKSASFSCMTELGSLTKFFTGLLSDAIWVIKEAKEFFDNTGKAIAFVEKQLEGFTDKALQTTASNIQKGITKVPGYTNEAADWANKAVYQCGFTTGADAAKCGVDTVTDAAKCGTSLVTSGAKCGYQTVTDAGKCGTDSITDGAKCGFDSVKECVKNILKGKLKCSTKQKPKSCKVPKSCKIEASCNVPKTCNIAKTCNIPLSC